MDGLHKSEGDFSKSWASEGESIRGFINFDMVVPNKRPKSKVLGLEAWDDFYMGCGSSTKNYKELLLIIVIYLKHTRFKAMKKYVRSCL